MNDHPSALLDNITWNALSGPQAGVSAGTGRVRRYAAGFSPIVGFADPVQPDLAALERFCDPGEHFYCDGWAGAPPAGWQVDAETTMFRMVWEGSLPEREEAPQALPVGLAQAGQALDLAALTRPGPFGPRTVELGEYFGCYEGERLVAMAGERMHAGPWREISGVCTAPDRQGRGLARRLMLKLIRRQMMRGERPFLHVMSGNSGAWQLYERMGFRRHLETTVRVITRQP